MSNVMEISTPLGADLLFHRMHGLEEISRLSEYQIALLSKRSDINPDEIMGKNVTVKLELPDGKPRFYNGFVTRFAQGGTLERYYTYHATVRPWLWFLTRRLNCRIFQDMTVRDIIQEILDDHKVTDVKFELTGNYTKWEYCVQYRESDFNFISRLMEQEGIYYFFRHQDKRHTAVIADSYSAHSAVGGYEQIPFIPTGRSTVPKAEHISSWNFEREIKPGRFVVDDYNFETPSVELQAKTTITRKHEHSDYEVYDYPGEYELRGDGEQWVKTRLEEIHANFELMQAHGNVRGATVGSLFKLTGHTRSDQNREYLITSSSCNMEYANYEGMGSGSGGSTFGCSFIALNSSCPFRPARSTNKPFVKGPQTAVVTGPSGDEIHTDKYGRVKVQFHWDREGKHDENTSCWLRVSHPWAGKNWGAISIPRIGQEVIVDFLEGDPDRPIITGRVYNAEQMPPWDLPANATQSGILSRSSKGAGVPNANAIRMEDKKGSEQLWIHAEKNQDIEVENDETHWVGHDRRKTIDHDETTLVKHDRTETVGNNETITIGVNRSETVGSNETISIGANRTETVGANETINIGANRAITVASSETATVALQRTHTVGVNETITVGAAQEITVGAAQAITVGAAQAITVGANQTNSIGSNQTTTVGSNQSLTVGSNQSESVQGNSSKDVKGSDALKVGKTITIDAGDAITIKTGSASISMKSDGTIVIKGKDITIDGSGKINVKASSDVVIKGSKVGIN